MSSDWREDDRRARSHRCEIQAFAGDDPCGRTATWFTPDLVDGDDTWMCDDCCKDILNQTDDVEVSPVDEVNA